MSKMDHGYPCGCGPAGSYHYCEEAYRLWDLIATAQDAEDWAAYGKAAMRYAKHFEGQDNEKRS